MTATCRQRYSSIQYSTVTSVLAPHAPVRGTQVDWRVKNVFTPVKSETRHCISSYALATTATVEAYLALDRGELIELSYEQVCIVLLQAIAVFCNR